MSSQLFGLPIFPKQNLKNARQFCTQNVDNNALLFNVRRPLQRTINFPRTTVPERVFEVGIANNLQRRSKKRPAIDGWNDGDSTGKRVIFNSYKTLLNIATKVKRGKQNSTQYILLFTSKEIVIFLSMNV